MSSIEVLKRKCGSFFIKDDREVLRAVVKDVHSIISEAIGQSHRSDENISNLEQQSSIGNCPKLNLLAE